MGKQVQIGSTENDIISIVSFIKDSFNCIIYKGFSSTQEQLKIDNLKDIFSENNTQIYIWNTNFKWQPVIKQTSLRNKLYYIDNKSIGPIIQISRSNWNPFEPGRIYWSKTIDPANAYDIKEYERFYFEIANWIKKNSKGIDKRSYGNIYFLDDAWKRFKS